jgi:hypothetical protein
VRALFCFLTAVFSGTCLSQAPVNEKHAQNFIVGKYIKPEIGLKTDIGFLMAHHSQMVYLVQGHCKSYELYAEWDGAKKNWHQLYRNPTVGLAAHLTDFGNRAQMGYAITIFPYVKFHLIKKELFYLNLRTGAGLAYLTKSFDRIENNKNSAIASHWNATLDLALEPEFHFQKFDLGLGLSFIHFSNGAWKMPNLGFNVPSLSLNLGYNIPYKSILEEVEDTKPILAVDKHHFELSGLAGVKEIMPANGPKYFIGNVNMQFRLNYSQKSNLLIFGDFNYSKAYLRAYENWFKTSADPINACRAGFGLGYGLSLDRLMLFFHNGFYVWDKLRGDTFMYHRIGARYYMDNKLILNFSLKTHFAKADVVEIGAGYRF